jgi:hypothetical protein
MGSGQGAQVRDLRHGMTCAMVGHKLQTCSIAEEDLYSFQ